MHGVSKQAGDPRVSEWRARLAGARELGPTGLLLAGATLMPLLGSALFVAALPRIEHIFRPGDALALALFVAGLAATAGLALVNTQVVALWAGWLWGFGVGLAASFAGILLAAALGHALASRLEGERFAAWLARSPRAAAVHAALAADARGATTTTMLLRVSPIVPFALVNVLLAAAKVPFPAFLVGSGIGAVPRTALVCFAGAQLASFDAQAGPDQWWRVWFALGASAALFAWLGWSARRALARRLAAPG
jgi:uncharacterized membrane protein YdjX (TVP38/TMEM64 family)